MPPEMPVLAEDWEKTPATVQAEVILLGEENQALKAQMVQMRNQIEKLGAQSRTEAVMRGISLGLFHPPEASKENLFNL